MTFSVECRGTLEKTRLDDTKGDVYITGRNISYGENKGVPTIRLIGKFS